jgi:hypothetical protein
MAKLIGPASSCTSRRLPPPWDTLGVSHLLHEAFLGMRSVLFWAER